MKPFQGLTKENTFNELYQKFPHSMDFFCEWIDQYKKAVKWNIVFKMIRPPKFHELPYSFQVGMWIEFLQNQGSDGQPLIILFRQDLKKSMEWFFHNFLEINKMPAV